MIPRKSADQFEDSFWMQDTRGVQCLSESLLPDSSRSYSNAGAMSWKGEHHYLRCCNRRRARGSSTKELAAEIWDTHTQPTLMLLIFVQPTPFVRHEVARQSTGLHNRSTPFRFSPCAHLQPVGSAAAAISEEWGSKFHFLTNPHPRTMCCGAPHFFLNTLRRCYLRSGDLGRSGSSRVRGVCHFCHVVGEVQGES